MQVVEELMVCVDCLFFIANSELPDDPDDAARVRESVCERPVLMIGDFDKDHEFSWNACHCCGSRLGGHRSHVVRLGEGN